MTISSTELPMTTSRLSLVLLLALTLGQALPVAAQPLSGQELIPLPPCRVADTRGNGFTGGYGPPALIGGASRDFVPSGTAGRTHAEGHCAAGEVRSTSRASRLEMDEKDIELFNDSIAHAVLKFRIGDRVSFQPEGHPPVTGMLTRYNKKTVSAITDTGQRWNVTSRLVRRAEDSGEAVDSNVIRLHKKRARTVAGTGRR